MAEDLISRQGLLNAYDKAHQGPPGGARKLIEDAPGGIVRCRDCKNFIRDVKSCRHLLCSANPEARGMKLNPIRLQAALKRSGMNQADLADKIGVQRVTISRYINGHRDPHRIHLQRMAEALSVSEDYLTARDDAVLTDEASLLVVIETIQTHADGWTRKQKTSLIKLICDYVEP